MKILALLDGRPGNDNQTIAIAEKLGAYETTKIEFGFLAQLPNFLLGTSKVGIKTKIDSLQPDLVIASGRKLARVAARLKKQTGCKAIQLMHPQINTALFDLVFVPEHDGISAHDNIHTTTGAANRIDAELLAAHTDQFANGINVALVGDVAPEEITQLEQVPNLHISTSRRTKPETVAALRALNPTYIYEWSTSSGNPYYALLAAAESIIVSADSVGMISEACTTGKKTYIFGNPKKPKFKKFIDGLIAGNFAKRLGDLGCNWQPSKLNTRDDVVQIIKNQLES